jgi:uncharacterized Tic20 family protein
MSSTMSNRGGTQVGSQDDALEIYRDDDKGFGWLFFSGSVLGLAGIMRIIDAIWAFSYKGAIPDNLKDGVLGDNIKTYAWVYLIVGVILLVSSFLVVTRNQFARWIGIIAAALAAISAITWMPYYPIWSLTYIALAVLVFYGLTAYGGRPAR